MPTHRIRRFDDLAAIEKIKDGEMFLALNNQAAPVDP